MHDAVLANFMGNADPREILLGPGEAVIVERTDKDKYWGDGNGQNRLRPVLMRVREELRSGIPRWPTTGPA
jgi:predicted NAD-dependent protein-ADP-ribosyltransferase YbiA (DUF1768 family)